MADLFADTRVGIYGGTFDPVHNGHVEAAKLFMEQMRLDYLFIIPSAIPPHKEIDPLDDPKHRLNMCKLAFEGMDGVYVSDMEIERGCNAVIYLGNVVVSSVTVNGKQLSLDQYKIENLMLTLYKDHLTEEINTVVINGDKTVYVTVVN